jgi:hypothetical protein
MKNLMRIFGCRPGLLGRNPGQFLVVGVEIETKVMKKEEKAQTKHSTNVFVCPVKQKNKKRTAEAQQPNH